MVLGRLFSGAKVDIGDAARASTGTDRSASTLGLDPATRPRSSTSRSPGSADRDDAGRSPKRTSPSSTATPPATGSSRRRRRRRPEGDRFGRRRRAGAARGLFAGPSRILGEPVRAVGAGAEGSDADGSWKHLALVGRDLLRDVPLHDIPLMRQIAEGARRPTSCSADRSVARRELEPRAASAAPARSVDAVSARVGAAEPVRRREKSRIMSSPANHLNGDEDECNANAARSGARCNLSKPSDPPRLQRLGVDAQRVAPHALERIELGDARARPAADRLPRRRAERQRRFDRVGERRRVAGRNEPAGALLGRRVRRRERRSRAPGRRPRPRSARPSRRPRSRCASTPSASLAGKTATLAATNAAGRSAGAPTRATIALTPRAAASASSSRANDGFAASPASTKRTSARPRLREQRGGFDDELLAARGREPGRREHDPFVRRGAPAFARLGHPLRG